MPSTPDRNALVWAHYTEFNPTQWTQAAADFGSDYPKYTDTRPPIGGAFNFEPELATPIVNELQRHCAPVFELQGALKHHGWGKRGSKSLVAQCHAGTDATYIVDEGRAYSEMWFGDIPSFPTHVNNGDKLNEVILSNPKPLLGEELSKYLHSLPFLVKIVSIAKGQPLKIHPNKRLARILHKKNKTAFRQDQHTPELAIALTRFEVFAGYRPVSKIEAAFQHPALEPFAPKLTGTDNWSDNTTRQTMRNILKADKNTIKTAVAAVLKAPRSGFGGAAYIPDMLPRLTRCYDDGDPTPLMALTCLKYLELSQGEALYLPADEAHVYITGDILECMSRDEKLPNWGCCPSLTPAIIDLWCDTVKPQPHLRTDLVLVCEKTARGRHSHTVVYQPNVSEFDIFRIELRPNEQEFLEGGRGQGILIVTKGKGVMRWQTNRNDQNLLLDVGSVTRELVTGSTFYVAPHHAVSFHTRTGIQIYMATTHY